MWWASSLQYNFGPSVTLPIFNAGRLQNTVELRTAQQQEAALTYHRTVLQAWHDVVNALTAHRLERERNARLKAQVDHARLALDIARTRYKQGVTEYLNVLNAQRTALLGRTGAGREHHQSGPRPRAIVQGARRRLGIDFSGARRRRTAAEALEFDVGNRKRTQVSVQKLRHFWQTPGSRAPKPRSGKDRRRHAST